MVDAHGCVTVTAGDAEPLIANGWQRVGDRGRPAVSDG
jgi:hypothetical protein